MLVDYISWLLYVLNNRSFDDAKVICACHLKQKRATFDWHNFFRKLKLTRFQKKSLMPYSIIKFIRRESVAGCLVFLFVVVVSGDDNDKNIPSQSVVELLPPHQHHFHQDLNMEQTPMEVHDHEEHLGIKIPYANTPVFLKYLAQTEHLVYNAIINYETQLQARLKIIERYRKDYENSVLQALQQAGKVNIDEWEKASIVTSHPFLSYRMIRRFAHDLHTFTENIWQSLEHDLWESLESWRGNFEWPSYEDLLGSMKSLMRLQNTHDFDIINFANGEIRDHSFRVGLTARQCLEVSQIALELNDITAATEWFQAAHTKVVNDQEDSVTMDHLTQIWEKTYLAFQAKWPMQNFKTHDVFSEAKSILRAEFDEMKMNRSHENSDVNFKSLCRGDSLRSQSEMANLICYINPMNAYWNLAPLQIEVHNWEPLVYQVHNFIGEQALSEINTSILNSMSSSMESGVALSQPNDANTFTYTWAADHSNIEFYMLSRKIELLTDSNVLNYGSSESYHISMYATGNHFEPCIDCFQSLNDQTLMEFGRKLTTIHIALHEPDQGGELAFTALRALVKPTVGSMIVFNNLLPNGQVDNRILHGSCPVLTGQKWTATKWIYEFE